MIEILEVWGNGVDVVIKFKRDVGGTWYGEGRRQYLEEVASTFLSKEEIDKEEDLDEGFVAGLILKNFKTVEEFNKEREVSHNVK
jgi:hypothetical protein